MPRIPKPPELLQRRNKSTTKATLATEKESAGRKVPALPARESSAEKWHDRVAEWWATVWTSPMASEFLGADMKGGLFNLAELYQRRWTEKDTKVLIAIIAEIRHQEIRFGLSPIDRRRLQWSIAQGEEAVDKVKRRKNSKRLAQTAKKDPRSVLSLVPKSA